MDYASAALMFILITVTIVGKTSRQETNESATGQVNACNVGRFVSKCVFRSQSHNKEKWINVALYLHYIFNSLSRQVIVADDIVGSLNLDAFKHPPSENPLRRSKQSKQSSSTSTAALQTNLPALDTTLSWPAFRAREETTRALVAQTVAQVNTVVKHHTFLVVKAVGFFPVRRGNCFSTLGIISQ